MQKNTTYSPLPWVIAILGLAVMIINTINGRVFHSFLEKQLVPLDHAYMPHFPAYGLLFLIGLSLFIGGIVVGVKQRRNHP
jgi:hypothetical protein